MKLDTLSMRIRKWSPLVQAALLPLAFVIGVGSFVLVASGTQKPAREGHVGRAAAQHPDGGRFLSVGKFGEVVQGHLAQKYPVSAYASCGSSPEHWVTGEPDFITKCGYRQHTVESDVFRDYVNGHPPRPTLTPKLTKLISKHKPTILIVQLGNELDGSQSERSANERVYRPVC